MDVEVESMPGDLKPVVAFHGHLCPGVLIGYRASKIALEKLRSGRSEDEELVAIVENDSCSVDAVQFMTGATFGKGNLVFRDYGKQVFTFIRRSAGSTRRQEKPSIGLREKPESSEMKPNLGNPGSGKALRVSLRADAREPENQTPQELDILEQAKAENPPDDIRQAARQISVRMYLEKPDEKLFDVEWVDVPVPEKARIHNSIICQSCGEKTMETRIVECEGRRYCIPCSEKRPECKREERNSGE